jgi:hypothetical protein
MWVKSIAEQPAGSWQLTGRTFQLITPDWDDAPSSGLPAAAPHDSQIKSAKGSNNDDGRIFRSRPRGFLSTYIT